MLAQLEPDQHLERLSQRAAACFDRLVGATPAAAPAADHVRRLLSEAGRDAYDHIPAEVLALEDANPGLAACVMARALSGLGNVCARRAVPKAIASECARQGDRMLASLESKPASSFSFRDDVVQKDLALALGTALPCVAQIVDLRAGLSRRLVLRRPTRESLELLGIYLRHRRLNPFYEIHTHTPMLDGFNEAGWNECYRMIAQLLRADTRCLGVIGASWFYDPALAEISPRLSYLREVPASGGAFFMQRGSTATDAALATATSPTRRALYEAGKYLPTAYLMVWQRRDLLAWSER